MDILIANAMLILTLMILIVSVIMGAVRGFIKTFFSAFAVLIALIIGAAACYIYREKKRGAKCIGCPSAKTCGGSCGCGGNSQI